MQFQERLSDTRLFHLLATEAKEKKFFSFEFSFHSAHGVGGFSLFNKSQPGSFFLCVPLKALQ